MPIPGHYVHVRPADQAFVAVTTVGLSDMPRDHVLRRERWRFYQFMWHLDGAGAGEVGGVPFEAEPGDVTFMPKDVAHSYRVRPGERRWRYLWVEFDGACAPQLLAMLGLGGRVHVADCGAAVGELVERIFTHFASRGDEALHENTALLMHAMTLVARAARRARSSDRSAAAIDRVKRHMAEHLAEPLTLASLAGVAGLSPFHLNRLFRAREQVPPMRYLRHLRANRAKAMLHRPELKVSEVGRAVGYPVLQHFSRMFKQETAMTPRRFIREVVR
jgi:AraC-like DNA-binding protein